RGSGSRREHLHAAGRAQSRHRLDDLAHRVAPWGRWDDLVVPAASVDRLRDVIDHMHHRETVFVDWGLGHKVAVWRRVTALFAGPPGTGKTLSASLVAQALGLDLFRIDLSGVVSKYIGETEKNLDRVFRAAHRSNAILFFDEADSLFGKRTEVKDAHDRYANVETAYLLQKLESFEGLAILATNFKKNIDAAFLRRIDIVVDFPMPGRDERRRLWRALLPAAMPLAGDVDLDFLADRFELAGGHIMNAIRCAATRAAATGQSVGMAPLLRGVRDELHKQGKLVSRDDLGAYAALLDAAEPSAARRER
ncbi:MAG TPA: ATP-binding protein, partial [Kofleriaceae bacterium]